MFAFFVSAISLQLAAAGDPLPSWNDTAPKKAILGFVQKVTSKGSSDYVPPDERIATFDNDGTLWTEQPLYFQFLYSFDRIKSLAPQHPEWTTKEPFASVIKGDIRAALAGGEKSLAEIMLSTQTGMSQDEFRKDVAAWVTTATHPKLRRPYAECIYQPMLEVLAYLRANGFKTFIVTGGDADFVRAFAQNAYGIPPEQIVGTTVKTTYDSKTNPPVVMRTPHLDFLDDGAGKPVGMAKYIGRHPLIAFGNSDGDYQMLEYTTRTPGAPRLGLIVRHTDAEREFAYDRDSHIGRLAKALDDAPANNWIVVDMKNDWKTIYPPQTQK